jgi:hypothetical protein
MTIFVMSLTKQSQESVLSLVATSWSSAEQNRTAMCFQQKIFHYFPSIYQVLRERWVKCESRIAPSRSAINRSLNKSDTTWAMVNSKTGVGKTEDSQNTKKYCTCSTSTDTQSQKTCKILSQCLDLGESST